MGEICQTCGCDWCLNKGTSGPGCTGYIKEMQTNYSNSTSTIPHSPTAYWSDPVSGETCLLVEVLDDTVIYKDTFGKRKAIKDQDFINKFRPLLSLWR